MARPTFSRWMPEVSSIWPAKPKNYLVSMSFCIGKEEWTAYTDQDDEFELLPGMYKDE